MRHFSLRGLLLTMIAFGALPLWSSHFLIPFAVIVAVSLLLSFGDDSSHAYGDDTKF